MEVRIKTGRYIFRDGTVDLVSRVLHAAGVYHTLLNKYPDTAHVYPKHLSGAGGSLTVNYEGHEITVLPDDGMQPNVTWIGTRE
jgi:hypothetical protein